MSATLLTRRDVERRAARFGLVLDRADPRTGRRFLFCPKGSFRTLRAFKTLREADAFLDGLAYGRDYERERMGE